MELELRMYGLVPYNISEIQRGIQFGHGVVEYAQKYFTDSDYQEWADKWKTFIILNGGISNHVDSLCTGSMETHVIALLENGIKIATFNEPDLNDMLSSIIFLVDERVFDRERYPDFDLISIYDRNIFVDPMNPEFPSISNLSGIEVRELWEKWVELIGGKQNLFLRNFLKDFRLA